MSLVLREATVKKFASLVVWLGLAAILALAGPLSAAPHYYFQDLGVLPGGNQSFANGINHAGQVVGEANLSSTGGATLAFLKTPGQPIQDLGVLEEGGGSKANGINHAGQVVGWARINTDEDRAFLWEKGVLYNLNDLTVNLPPGIVLRGADAINDQGWIIGSVTSYEVYLLTPAGRTG
jgi:probable HAF family extracellular repeat protein